jgi:tRNA pseudouridine38-40 synthase
MSKRITHVLKVEYDGTNYSGWQRQKNGLSIQHAIEQALYRLTGHEIHVK